MLIICFCQKKNRWAGSGSVKSVLCPQRLRKSVGKCRFSADWTLGPFVLTLHLNSSAVTVYSMYRWSFERHKIVLLFFKGQMSCLSKNTFQWDISFIYSLSKPPNNYFVKMFESQKHFPFLSPFSSSVQKIPRVPIISREWVLDIIATYKIQPMADYLLSSSGSTQPIVDLDSD